MSFIDAPCSPKSVVNLPIPPANLPKKMRHINRADEQQEMEWAEQIKPCDTEFVCDYLRRSDTVAVKFFMRSSAASPLSNTLPSTVVSMFPPHKGTTIFLPLRSD